MRQLLVITSILCFAGAALPAEKERASRPVIRKVKAQPRQATSSTNTEVLGKNFTVGPKQSKSFTAALDYSGAERVSIAIESPPDQDLSNIRVFVWWSMPEADFWVLQDALSGMDFYFLNQGGGVVPVYGPELQIEVQNDDTVPLNFDQLTVFAVVH